MNLFLWIAFKKLSIRFYKQDVINQQELVFGGI